MSKKTEKHWKERLDAWVAVARAMHLINEKCDGDNAKIHGILKNNCPELIEALSAKSQLFELLRNLDKPIDEPSRVIGIREWYMRLDVMERGAFAWQCMRIRPRNRNATPLYELFFILDEWKRTTEDPERNVP